MELTIGSQFRTVRTGVGTIPFNSGNVSTLDIPKTLFHRQLVLRLSGTFNVGGAPVYNAQAPLTLIRKIELIGDGVKSIVSLPGTDAFRFAHFLEHKQAELVAPTGIGAAVAFSAVITLHHEALGFRKPVDSYLDPRPFDNYQLKITWGTATDLQSAGTAPVVNVGTQIDVQLQQTVLGENDIAFRRLLIYDEYNPSGANSNFQIKIPRIGLLTRVMVHAEADSAPSNALINFLTVKSDSVNVHHDRLAWETLRQSNIKDYQVDSPVFGAGIAGYAMLDFTEDGMLSSGLNTTQLNTLDLLIDNNATGATRMIRTVYEIYEPILPVAA